jgi:outer membrane lipoprotein carrier protein
MKRALIFGSMIAAAASVFISAAQVSVQDIVIKAEKTLSSLQSFQADFEQTFYATTVSKPLKEKGRVYMNKPDLMRWEYKDPEEKVIVFKEGILLSYMPEDNQLFRQKLAKEQYETEILAFLAGKGHLAEKYLIESSPFPREGGDVSQLKLIPREEGEYTSILLEIDKKTWLIKKAIFFDWAGNKNEFAFAKIRINARLPGDLFEIKVPPDCEIIDDAAPRKK